MTPFTPALNNLHKTTYYFVSIQPSAFSRQLSAVSLFYSKKYSGTDFDAVT
ncbi:MAG: hypothetical protein F6J90_26130 [Moorea sp. SIOASIH]|nr:hypothetical protein [Moorena sp. SIOASIH]